MDINDLSTFFRKIKNLEYIFIKGNLIIKKFIKKPSKKKINKKQ